MRRRKRERKYWGSGRKEGEERKVREKEKEDGKRG